MAGVVFGRRWGVIAGVWLGLSAYAQVPLPHGKNGEWSASIVSSMALYCAAGWAAGYLMNRLREAEVQITSAKAREEVARTLHDGVLQTLAVIQRRSDDAELASMAREQEVELRQFLTGAANEPESLAPTLRDVAAKHESRYDVRVQVVVADDCPAVSAEIVKAISGAVREALTNANKHGDASSITIFAEPADEDGVVFCSIKDDGTGFDVEATAERIGTSRSIKGRIVDVGGRVEISSRLGRGTEVRLWAGGPRR
jgi:signal transduction histidine kinase